MKSFTIILLLMSPAFNTGENCKFDGKSNAVCRAKIPPNTACACEHLDQINMVPDSDGGLKEVHTPVKVNCSTIGKGEGNASDLICKSPIPNDKSICPVFCI